MYTVVKPVLGKYPDIDVADVPPILMVKLPKVWAAAETTSKATELMLPALAPAAAISDARIKYCTRPSIQYVLYGVKLDAVVVLVRVPVPNV